MNMSGKLKSSNVGSITIPAGAVNQTLWKGNTKYINQNRGYAASGPIKLGTDGYIRYETGRGGSFRPCIQNELIFGDLNTSDAYPQFGTPSNPALWSGVTMSTCSGLTRYALPALTSAITAAANSGKLRSVSDINWTELSARAYQAMRPTMAANNSLLNFVYELRDIKGMAHGVLNILHSRLYGVRALIRAISAGSHKAKTMKGLSSQFLAYNFAWRPFISDVLNLYTTMTNFEKKLSEFKKRALVPQSRRWTTTISNSGLTDALLASASVGVPGGSVGSFIPNATVRLRRDKDDGITYTATMRYIYDLPSVVNMTVDGLRKAALFDALGVRPSARILWNAIPFSFLLDWVTNIGKLLDRASLDNLQAQVRVSEFCHSAKASSKLRLTVQLNWMNQGNYQLYPETTHQAIVIKQYQRIVGLPSIAGTLSSSDMTPMQVALGGALLGANTP
nr:MAG: maturation protein [Sanya steitz-like virus 2]